MLRAWGMLAWPPASWPASTLPHATCFSVRRGCLSEAGDRDPGRAGLVLGPAGDPADQAFCQRDGLQQGERRSSSSREPTIPDRPCSSLKTPTPAVLWATAVQRELVASPTPRPAEPGRRGSHSPAPFPHRNAACSGLECGSCLTHSDGTQQIRTGSGEHSSQLTWEVLENGPQTRAVGLAPSAGRLADYGQHCRQKLLG